MTPSATVLTKRVVAEASQPGVTVAQIARRYDLDARRISNWKTKFGFGALVPVEVMPDDDNLSVSAENRPTLRLERADVRANAISVLRAFRRSVRHRMETLAGRE